MIKSRMWVVAAVAACVALPGCDNDPLKKVKVQGTVTFDGGPCPASGRVTLAPVEIPAGLPNRPAMGAFKTDGKYEAMSFRPGDGVVPGTYLVTVACYDRSKLSGSPGDAELERASYVSEEFEPEELVIEPGSVSITFDIDVPKRKN